MKRAGRRKALVRAVQVLCIALAAELAAFAMLVSTSGALPASTVKADTVLMAIGPMAVRDAEMPETPGTEAEPEPEQADDVVYEVETGDWDDEAWDEPYDADYDGYGYDRPYDCSHDGGYDADYFRRMGVIPDGDYRYTWYSQRVLPGGGLDIPGRTVNDDGYVTDGDGNICLASSDLAYGTVVETPFGTGVVYDTGCDSGTLDVYTDW